MATSTVEDYLKHIYFAQGGDTPGQVVPMGELAKRTGVTPGTATTMIKALTDAGLTLYEPRVGVRLSPSGHRLALTVVRKHRIVEQFLVDILKMDWSEVHAEAEQLEHAISDKVLARMDQLLGHPTVDPHGDPIPNATGELVSRETAALWESEAGSRVVIARILDQQSEFLDFLESRGLRPGNPVTIVSVDSAAGTIALALGEQNALTTLSREVADRIEVEPIRL